MARPAKAASIDYGAAHVITNGLLERATCPVGQSFVLVRDIETKGLRLRVTKAGGKHWQFETRMGGVLITRALGEWPALSISEAQTAARTLRNLTTQGINPNEQDRQRRAERDAAAEAEAAQAVTVGSVWPTYLENGRPKRKAAWKPRYRSDLERMASAGGEPKARGKGLTRPGPLYPLLALRLSDVTEDALHAWHETEAQQGPHQAARALMMFRGFLRWCSTRPEYRKLVDVRAGAAPAIVQNLPENTRRTDALQTAQIAPWWTGTEQLGNRAAVVYLLALLLTGARREEMAALRWENVEFRWRKLVLADKVKADRTIPLTPYLAQLLATLPRVNEFVFASTGKAGRIVDARNAMARALEHAGVAHVTFHGLRRTFIQQARKVVPAGAPAQIAGHAPSATAEGYAILSIDELRPHAEAIERHILQLAGVVFDATLEPGKLRAIV